MKILKEITLWPDNTPNHIYYVNDGGKLVGYDRGAGREDFTLPRIFDRKGRKFQTLEDIQEELAPGATRVKGSNGKTYTVTAESCSCPGFKFKGKCKHQAMVS